MTAQGGEHALEPAVNLRAARPRNLAAIRRLLIEAGLPTSGVEDHLETFVVVEADTKGVASVDGDILGVGGLEIHGRFALLRSLAVGAESRRKGIASTICARLEDEALGRGIDRIYLLTETAESFFAGRGYSVSARADAPAEILATEEFTTLCPESAVLMVRTC
jgi:amino-acid N-acetyltransferase